MALIMSEADNSMALMLGEIRGQVRQIVEQFAALSAKLEALTTAVNQAAHLPEEMQALKLRVAALEAAEQQRRGAMSLGSILIKALPWVGPAIVTAATVAIAMKGLGQ